MIVHGNRDWIFKDIFMLIKQRVNVVLASGLSLFIGHTVFLCVWGGGGGSLLLVCLHFEKAIFAL